VTLQKIRHRQDPGQVAVNCCKIPGGKNGLRGKSDTGRSINEQVTNPRVKDMKANDKYFSIGAALLIGIIAIALIVRYRKRPNP
jgi:hypothetical protein